MCDLWENLKHIELKWWLDTSLTVIGAVWALYLFHRRLASDRAKWVTALYEKFYENKDLKYVRQVIDCDNDDAGRAAIGKLIANHEREFTDYHNFFEYVAYLRMERHLTQKEVDGLFSYYLDCLKKHPEVVEYTKKYGFRKLSELLSNR